MTGGPTHGKARDANEPEIVEAFERLGCSVERIDVPCDLIVGFLGVTHLVEVKTERGKLTQAQILFTLKYKGKLHIVRSVEGVAILVASWRPPIVGKDCR